MPSAASVFISRVIFITWSGFSLAASAPSLLIDDKFDLPDDSLWHFQTTAFKEGVLSPGLEADPHGRGFATGQLRVDASASSLRFIPRHGTKEHRSCFLGYRSDFRMDSVYARHVQVEFTGEIANPAGTDSVGGLYVLVRYADDMGYPNLARTTADIRGPQIIDLDTANLVQIRKTDWLAAPQLSSEVRARPCPISSGSGSAISPRAAPPSSPNPCWSEVSGPGASCAGLPFPARPVEPK